MRRNPVGYIEYTSRCFVDFACILHRQDYRPKCLQAQEGIPGNCYLESTSFLFMPSSRNAKEPMIHSFCPEVPTVGFSTEDLFYHMSRDFFIDKRIYQEVDIDHCGCRHFPWGRRRA